MILLRNMVEDDLEKVLNWRTSEHINKYMFTDVPYNMKNQINWFNSIKKDQAKKYWIIVYKNYDIGVVYLSDINWHNLNCFKGYYIAEPFARDLGLSCYLECNLLDYLFFRLNINKINVDVFAFNHRAIHIYYKYGYEVEDVFKKHIFKNGKYRDVMRMGIFVEKWKSIKYNYSYEKIFIEDE